MENKFKGTPGPWKMGIGKVGHRSAFNVSSDFKQIKNGPQATISWSETNQQACQIGGGTPSFYHNVTDEEAKANARAISKVPEMIKVLCECEDYFVNLVVEGRKSFEAPRDKIRLLMQEITNNPDNTGF